MLPKYRLPNIHHVIAVASGKGGVGKTTVTVNLALALQHGGRLGVSAPDTPVRVGIFDADVYGPNVPLMLGVHRRQANPAFVPVVRPRGAAPYIQPVERFGLKLMSIGLLMAEDQVINPPADQAGQIVVQTLVDMLWGELDYLLIDLPPSAGQPQEDLLTRLAIDGVIVVTTPQDLSLLDSSRSLHMYRHAGVPVLGVVENMSYFVCPGCGERHEIFERSEHWRPGILEDVPLLGRVPLAPEISRGINQASPLMRDHPDDPQARAFLEIATALREHVQARKQVNR